MATANTPRVGTIPAMSAGELRQRIVARDLTAMDVAEALLSWTAELEPEICAWAWLNPEYVHAQAKSLDAWQRAGKPLGPLHGVPVALKDIIDTQGIPTEYGCVVTAGRVPDADAAIVKRLRASGALIMGKTVTTELAFMHPGPTRNPLNLDHTPGGSSSGSAAAVAAGMVPLAIGTQTGGSIIRPAAYCGIVGFKPSFGKIPRDGVLTQSPSLDTVGVFARNLQDAALLVDCLADPDRSDLAPVAGRAPAMQTQRSVRADRPMRMALVRLPGVAAEHFDELRAALIQISGSALDIVERALPEAFDHVVAWRECINFSEMAYHYDWLEEKDGNTLSRETRAAMEAGAKASATDYLRAQNAMEQTHADLMQQFPDCDAILSTATAGRAPRGLESTGSSICNGLWTFAGVPSITVPIPGSEVAGLPIGVQISALRGQDSTALIAAMRISEQLLGRTG